jgi:hypothetical protein
MSYQVLCVRREWDSNSIYYDLIHCLLQWVVQGAVDVDIGANPSAEGGDDDEGVDDQSVKVVDIVDTFRLQVSCAHKFL